MNLETTTEAEGLEKELYRPTQGTYDPKEAIMHPRLAKERDEYLRGLPFTD